MIIQRKKIDRKYFQIEDRVSLKVEWLLLKSLRKISVTFFPFALQIEKRSYHIVSNKKVDVKSKKVFFSAAIRHHNILALTGGVRRKS